MSEYQWLTRRRRRRKGFFFLTPRSALLLGKDHLLEVESTSFAEQYKRFAFRDIQAITIRTTRRREIWNLVLGLILAVSLAELLWGNAGPFRFVVTMALAAISGLLLVINNLLGTACDVFLKTAVQVEQLAPLSRVKRALRVLDTIRPLIEEAQGRLTPEEAALQLQQENEPVARPDRRTVTGPLNL